VSYTVAALLGVVGALVVDLAVLRTRLVCGVAFWAAYPIILFFQLISNGVLTGRGIVRYDSAAIAGPRLAHAPVEDLLFGFALVLVTLSTWVWLGRRGVQPTPAAGQGSRLLRRLRSASRPESRSANRPASRTEIGAASASAGEGRADERPRAVSPACGSPLPPDR